MIKKEKKRVPELRFPEFHEDWVTDRTDHFLVRYVNAVSVQLEKKYKQIGIRSHGKGIFHKDPVTGEALGNKRVYWVHPEVFTVNIVFAWEQAVALTSSDEEGYIASHRFLMFLPKENRVDLKFVLLFFLRRRGKYLLELASPGGAGRNKTLGQESFAELEITLPQKEEQEKIASFLGAVDTRLNQLRRKRELLQTYKRGVMQKFFSQEIRFKGAIGSEFPDWENKRLEELFSEFRSGINITSEAIAEYGTYPVFGGNGLRGYAESFTHDGFYFLIGRQGALCGNINRTYGKAYISEHAIACKANETSDTEWLAQRLDYYNLNKLSESSAEPGLSVKKLLRFKLLVPSKEEQQKMTDFLMMIDRKIETLSRQIDQTEQFKKGLLQKLFV
ncbi:restriction endonuclease subunit S [Nostoc sp.]|uniref:restriction endonuclease subunit S n=1 Tax=Nostoc sp. TaxID=1180 RepID=UPI002FF5DF46